MNNFQRYLAEEFAEDYQEGRLTRREALKMIASITGSMVLAQTFLAACAPPAAAPTATSAPTNTAEVSPTATSPESIPNTGTTATTGAASPTAAVGVSPDDPDIEAAAVEFPDDNATLMGYLARPKGDGPFAVVLVCHENRGLTDHIKDVTRRLAKAGYVGLAVDLLSRQGGTATLSADQVPGALGGIDPKQFVADFISGWHYLQKQPFADAARVGMVGFCFGGGVTWQVAVGMPELKAAVPFYGPPPSVDDVPKIQAPVLALYGGRDQRITSTEPTMEAAMQKNNKVFEKMIYPDADHAFNNDTGTRYNPEAAKDAWARTLAWFGKYLGPS